MERRAFKTEVRRNIQLLPGATLTLDVGLAIADVAERVVVDAPPPIVDVRTSASPTLIDRGLLENLPLSRQVSSNVNLAPGVVIDVAYGGTAVSNPFFLDGANGNEPGFGTPFVAPNLNWVEEIQVVAVGADAQYGEFTGAQVNAITRSGSNRFSGLVDYLTTRPSWVGNNRGSLTPQLKERFRPVEIIERWDADVQLGGPVWKDRLWFFAGGEIYRDVKRPVSFSGIAKTPDEPTSANQERKYIAKLSAAFLPGLRGEGYIGHAGSDSNGNNAGPLVTPEALNKIEIEQLLWNARAMWMVGSRAAIDVRHGGASSSLFVGPASGARTGPPGHFDRLTGVSSVNFPTHSTNEYKPVTTKTQLTYLPRRAPGHELQVGFEFEHASLLAQSGYIGGRFFLDFDGRPDQVQIREDPTYRPSQHRATLYAHDSWSLSDRVTVNAGVRSGFYVGSVPTHRALEATTISPRVGVAWSPSRSHRTAIRAHYGRYHDQFVTGFYDFQDPLSEAPTIIANVVGPDDFVEVARIPSGLHAVIDPKISYPFVEEYLAAVETQLPWAIALKAQFVRRDFRDTIGFVDDGLIWEPVQRQDPGADGRTGTTDDGQPLTVFLNTDSRNPRLTLTNPEDAFKRYNALQFAATKRYSGDLAFQASYTWSRTVGSYNNSFATNAASGDLGPSGNFVNPNKRINTTGRTPQDFPHEFKVLGTYHLTPWGGTNVSAVYRYQSGRSWARSVQFAGPTLTAVLVEPRASRRLPALQMLDLRIEKTWTPVVVRGTLGVFADVFNVGNEGAGLAVNGLSGANFGVPLRWIEPRSLRAGVRMTF